MAFLLWYTNYFIDINSDNSVDPRTIESIGELGNVSTNGNNTAWHIQSQLGEEDFNRHLNKILTDNTKINPDDVTVTKGIDGGPFKML
ncbi:hypothetical protein [Companilactobacillus halodurans]|uniref:Uncharacterized protein n=1 Tax=Companilactobacillus halodurans TaxID=2584183 RepID=A0A5P0ZZ02_9LACO|nr:hypothetical protein [Companilactobacillus halodurans]MQS74893.1 hypothetical protein [Companilactobacillus halodurans]MQS98279.1 hypothetical protein [Companilactobacillus halodurans]